MPDVVAAVLVVQHQRDCPPARLGDWLGEAGCVLDVRRPYAGDTLPVDLTAHAALVVLGGSAGAYDDATNPWFLRVRALFRYAARNDVPALGLCLGHQLAATAFGGQVARNPHGSQTGVYDVAWTEPLLGHRPNRVLHWNDDVVVTAPDDATVLARAAQGEIQVLRFAETTWGIQGHPEVDESVVRAWAASDQARSGDRDVARVVGEYLGEAVMLEAAWRPLVHAFAATIT